MMGSMWHLYWLKISQSQVAGVVRWEWSPCALAMLNNAAFRFMVVRGIIG